jgi:hypothetical protein
MQSAEHWNQALQNCLDLCRRAPFPPLFIAEFLMILRNQGGWAAEELADFRSLIVRLLTNGQRQGQPGDSRLSGELRQIASATHGIGRIR